MPMTEEERMEFAHAQAGGMHGMARYFSGQDQAGPGSFAQSFAGNEYANKGASRYGLRDLMGSAIQDSGYARQYRESLDELSRKRLQEGLGDTQRAMASQAMARGSSPLAARAAVYAGGQAGMQATNQNAQQTAQADMAGAQLAQQQKQLEMQGIAAIMQQQQAAAQMANQRRLAQMGIDAQNDQWFKNTMVGIGTGAASALSMGLTGGAM